MADWLSPNPPHITDPLHVIMEELNNHIRIFEKDEHNIVQVDTWELKDFVEDYYREECDIDYDFYQDVNPQLSKFNKESYNLFFNKNYTINQLKEFTSKLDNETINRIVLEQRSQLNGKFFCPCCGYNTLDKFPDSWEICEYCFWENDPVQNSDPTYAGGANENSLMKSKQNYNEFGSCNIKHRDKVKTITSKFERDPNYK